MTFIKNCIGVILEYNDLAEIFNNPTALLSLFESDKSIPVHKNIYKQKLIHRI